MYLPATPALVLETKVVTFGAPGTLRSFKFLSQFLNLLLQCAHLHNFKRGFCVENILKLSLKTYYLSSKVLLQSVFHLADLRLHLHLKSRILSKLL